MPEKAPKIATHLPRHNKPVVQQASFIHKKGEQAFFAPNHNHTTQTAPAFIQPKLQLSKPGDPFEQEADQQADKVMRMNEPSNVMASSPATPPDENIQRKEEEEVQTKMNLNNGGTILQRMEEEAVQLKENDEEQVQQKEEDEQQVQPSIFRKPLNLQLQPNDEDIQPKVSEPARKDRGPPTASTQFENKLHSNSGNGKPLDNDTKQFMESRFNADFSGVQVHAGGNAVAMSSSINAQAFTHGNNIYFNAGKYNPGTGAGRHLLAHELTHTIQQGASPSANNFIAAKTASPTKSVLKKSLPLPAAAPIVQRSVADPNVLSQIDLSARSGGHQMPKDAREYLQGYFNTGIDDIRLHSDNEIATVCREAGVNAFVKGKDIAIIPSRFNLESEQGAVLLSDQVAKSLAQRGIKTTVSGGGDTAEGTSLSDQIQEAVAENKAEQAATSQPLKAPPAPLLPAAKASKATGKKVASAADKKSSGSAKHFKKKKNTGDGLDIKPLKKQKNKSPSTPAEDPAFLKVLSKTKATAKGQRQHETAAKKSDDAQKNAEAVPKEADGKAQGRKTDGMGTAAAEDKPFDAATFKADLLKKIEEIAPKNLKEASDFKNNNKIEQVKAAVNEKVETGKQTTTGPVNLATATPLQIDPADTKKPMPLPPTLAGARPAGLGAKDAIPKDKTGEEISMKEQSGSLDKEMKANNITDQQLKGSKEPSFSEALKEKKNAQKDAADAPKQYQKEEATVLKEAKSEAVGATAKNLAGMHGARGKNFSATVQQQQTAKQKDEAARTKVTTDIEAMYQTTELAVTTALDGAEKLSVDIFETGAAAAAQEFETYVGNKMDMYKLERYSGFWGSLRWVRDKLVGMPNAVNKFYTEGRKMYLGKMDVVITEVSNIVTLKLNEAKTAIKDGKKKIDEYIAKLPADQQEIGKEAASLIQDKFDSLEQNVNDKRDGLIEGFAKKYVDNVKKLDERIEALKEANKGLIDKAIGFLKKVWKVIKDLTNLFTTILARLASIIGIIIGSPGSFFSNVGKAFKKGFNNFKNKFLDYLEQGLMEWLATNLGIAGLELPEKFTPASILSLVLQVMGITKMHIRERAVALLGERKVVLLEGAGGLLHKVYNEGLGALWELIVEKITDFKEIIWEAIKSFIKTKIIEAAITFLLSLLNPIGAFVKVCMAIYDFLMMLVRFKDKIIELLDTILNAVTDIASGAIDSAANAIEKAFAKSIPIIIAFLAALLHLNDIAVKVRSIINRIRARVDKAIDYAITKAWSFIGKGVEGALRLQDKGIEMVDKGKVMVVKGKDKAVVLGKAAANKLLGWLKRIVGMEKKFKGEDGSDHRVYYALKGNAFAIILNPDPASEYETWVMDIEIDTTTAAGKKREEKRKQALHKAREIDGEKVKTVQGENAEKDQADKMRKLLDELSYLTGPLFTGLRPDCSSTIENGLDFSPTFKNYGKEMKAKTLTYMKMPDGSIPGVSGNADFDIINQRRNQKGSYYVLGHLLNHNLGGTGKEWKNLTPLTRQANSRHESIAEARVKNAVTAGNIVYYKVEAVYGRSVPKSADPTIQKIMDAEQAVPEKLICEAEMITPDQMSKKGSSKRVSLIPKDTQIENNISQHEKDYDLTGIKKDNVHLDSGIISLLQSIDGIDALLAKKITDAFTDKVATDDTRFVSFESLAAYKFTDGSIFTTQEKKTIIKLKDLAFVKLYKGT